ncbi:hypothetical protein [Streptomyces sp. NPDC058812]|uniref:hypothetical protein n=1 Tax=unclassified Streptomyces TaxID=2593676 RepID=UPI003689B517
MRRSVSWSEAVLVAAACWAVSGLGYAASAALDEPRLSVAPLIGAGLVQWFWVRHRSWPAGFAAGFVGATVLFALVDSLRPELVWYVADALATGAAATVSVALFTLVGRVAPSCRRAVTRSWASA